MEREKTPRLPSPRLSPCPAALGRGGSAGGGSSTGRLFRIGKKKKSRENLPEGKG